MVPNMANAAKLDPIAIRAPSGNSGVTKKFPTAIWTESAPVQLTVYTPEELGTNVSTPEVDGSFHDCMGEPP